MQKKLRILLLSSSYLPKIGGLEIFTANLGSAFSRESFIIKVITQKYPRELKRKEFINGIEVNRFLFFDPKPPILKPLSIASYIYNMVLIPLELLRFINSIRKFCPDVINYHFVGSPTFFILAYLTFFNMRLIISLHGEDVRTLPFESKISMFLFKAILKKANFVTTNSRYTLNRAISIAPFIKDKSKVVYNGINLKEFKNVRSYKHRTEYILSIGRLIYKKGFDMLIRAFSLVAKEIGNVDLVIVGDGFEKTNLIQLIKALDLVNRVFLYGLADREEVVSLLKGCKIFVLPSRNESFGMVILEAMACRKPIIATKSGGPEEIIRDGLNGLLIEKNVYSLTQTISRLLKNIGLQIRLSEVSGEVVKNFDMENVAVQYLDIMTGK